MLKWERELVRIKTKRAFFHLRFALDISTRSARKNVKTRKKCKSDE